MFGNSNRDSTQRVIIVANHIDVRVLYAIRYSRTISDNITVFGTLSDEADVLDLRLRWEKIGTGIPLVMRYMPDGGVVEPLLEFIQSDEYGCRPDEVVTVVLPRLVVTKWWQNLLHNHASSYIERRVSEYRQIKAVILPVQLEDDSVNLYR
jgi:hypothetical protein